MRIARDQTFEVERGRFRLVHCCEECGLFDRHLQSCAHEWPDGDHRRSRYERPGPDIVFCKEFELC